MMAEVNIQVLKKGFLVKKRVQKKRWKTCWCILYEENFVYYRKKDSASPVGQLSLHGASVDTNLPTYEDRKAVFKLSLGDGREYLWQCPSKDERDIWSLTLIAAIRSLDSTALNRSNSYCPEVSISRINLSDVLIAMQDKEAGLSLQPYQTQSKEYKNCFTGSSVIDWLIKWHFADTRQEAQRLAKILLCQVHFVVLPSRSSKSCDEASTRKEFCDSADVYYRFTAIVQSPNRQSAFFADSSSDSAGSSDAEVSEGDILDSDGLASRGRIVKEGFLMKKGYRFRKRWKVRKVVLREDPPSLSYYSASKNNVQLLKSIPLDDAFVVDMQEYESQSGAADASSKHACVFGLTVQFGPNKRTLLTFQADDLLSKKDWIECLQRICRSSKCVVETNE